MSGDEPISTGDEPTGWRRWLNLNTVGLLLIGGSLVFSLGRVASISHELNDPNVKIIRIAHWQLETGYREALQTVIDDYNAMHADKGVKVIQMGVTEKVYPQWLNTQLIAGTAPDISGMGQARLVTIGEAVAKYFLPLGDEILGTNPYNAPEYLNLDPRDTHLAEHLSTAPWRDTFIDNLRSGYRDDLQDYYSIPTSVFSVRMFYNKDMLREATGTDQPPQTLGELFKTCEAIRELGHKQGQTMVPIAGSAYSRGMFLGRYRVPFTSHYQETIDTDIDGTITAMETWAALQAGRMKFDDPGIIGYYECMRELCAQFSRGFETMERDQAMFLFVQGKAAMIASGAWDAASIMRAPFPVGIMSFPVPGPGERWEAFNVPQNEAGTNGAGHFGIVKDSPNREWAIDFMRFLTSQRWNQKLVRGAGWLPVTIAARPEKNMEGFTPEPVGSNTGFDIGGPFNLSTIYQGLLWPLLTGEKDYDHFRSGMLAAFDDPNGGIDQVWKRSFEVMRDEARKLERTIAVQSARELLIQADDAPRKRGEVILQQMITNNGNELRARYTAQNGSRPFPQVDP